MTIQTPRTSLPWRAAHAWLRGYSDAREGKAEEFPTTLDAKYAPDYGRGYENYTTTHPAT